MHIRPTTGRPRALLEQGRQLGDRAAAFLRLVADIDLDEAIGPPAALRHRPGQRGGERRAVERMDRVEQGDRLLRLVRLEPADQMEADVRDGGARSAGHLRLRLLHPILAEVALALVDQRLDRLGGLGLGDGDQGDLVRLAPGERGGLGDAGLDLAAVGIAAWRCYRKRRCRPASLCRACG